MHRPRVFQRRQGLVGLGLALAVAGSLSLAGFPVLASSFAVLALLGLLAASFAQIKELSAELERLGAARDAAETALRLVDSERLQAQVALTQSSRLAAVGEMAAAIAHEINNPVTIISGRARQAMSLIAAEEIDRPALLKINASMEEAGSRIAKIVRGMRALSGVGGQESFGAVRLGDVIDDVLLLCAHRFKYDEIEIRLSFDREIRFECLRAQFGQVLLSLLNNARDAVSAVDVRWIELSADVQDGLLTVAVVDSGAGVPTEIAEKVMQPFFTTKDAAKNKGLGLSISKGIIDAHGGSLHLDRASAHTRFAIRMPAHRAPITLPAVSGI